MKLLFICTEMKQPDPFIGFQDTHPQQFILEDKLTPGIQKPLNLRSLSESLCCRSSTRLIN